MSARLLTVSVGPQLYGVAIDAVREVLVRRPLLPVPLAPSPLCGLVLVRGDVLTGIDLRQCLGADPHDGAVVDAVVLEVGTTAAALVVDEVGDIVELAADQELAPPDGLTGGAARLAAAAAVVGDRPVLVLDAAEICRSALSGSKELV